MFVWCCRERAHCSLSLVVKKVSQLRSVFHFYQGGRIREWIEVRKISMRAQLYMQQAYSTTLLTFPYLKVSSILYLKKKVCHLAEFFGLFKQIYNSRKCEENSDFTTTRCVFRVLVLLHSDGGGLFFKVSLYIIDWRLLFSCFMPPLGSFRVIKQRCPKYRILTKSIWLFCVVGVAYIFFVIFLLYY